MTPPVAPPPPFTAQWLAAYRASIMLCAERYRLMTSDPDLLSFLEEFGPGVPLLKLDRWIGYVQGAVVAAGLTTVQAERDWTRNLFRPLDYSTPDQRLLPAPQMGETDESE